jgi:hypothetical protein
VTTLPETLTCDGVTLRRFELSGGLPAWSGCWRPHEHYIVVVPAGDWIDTPSWVAMLSVNRFGVRGSAASANVLRIREPVLTPEGAAATLEQQIKVAREAFAPRRRRKGATR